MRKINQSAEDQISLAKITEAKLAISLVDLTNLDENAKEHQILYLIQRALKYKVACVCVYPKWIEIAKPLLERQHIKVATVVNFPSGNQNVDFVLAETKDALEKGADEIDVVFPYEAYIAGDTTKALNLISEVAKLCHNYPTKPLIKVILESGAFEQPELLAQACHDLINCNVDFLKTSTGKISQGANLHAVMIMLLTIKEASSQGKTMGLKISGGLKQFTQLHDYFLLTSEIVGEDFLNKNTFRIGASSLLDDLVQTISGLAHG